MGLDSHEPTPPPREHGIIYSFRAFKHKNFSIFWVGALLSNIGGWLSNLAVPFVLYDITGEATWVGLASVAQFVPGIILGPLGGSLADRFDRRKVLILTQLGMTLSAMAMWFVWVQGFHDAYVLLLLVMLIGSFGGLNMPTWQSFVSDLVPRGDLMSAVTLNSLQFNAARSIGPAIAGILLAASGPALAFLLNGISFSFVIISLLVITLPKRIIQHSAKSPVLRQFTDAVKYTRRTKGLLSSILLSVIVGILGNPLFTLTVVYAEDIYKVDEVALGMMNAALGLGAMIAAPIVSGWSKFLPSSKVVKWGMIVYGVALALFSLTTAYWVGIIMLVIIGACFLSVISGLNTSLQLMVADPMRGRVIALRHMLYTLSFPVGAMFQAWMADMWNVQVSLFVAGVLMVISVFGILMLRSVSFASLDIHPEDMT